MKLLVVTSEPITAEQLRGAVPDGADPGDVDVMVVAPALQESALRFWLSDVDDAIARADQVRRATANQLGQAGVAVKADTGESDPLEAIEDGLRTFEAERIVLFTHPESRQRYREDLDVGELQQRFGLPVDHATVSG